MLSTVMPSSPPSPATSTSLPLCPIFTYIALFFVFCMYPGTDVTCLFLADDGCFASMAEKDNFATFSCIFSRKNTDVVPEDVACSQISRQPKVRKPLQACAEVAETYHCCDHLCRESWNELQCGTLDRSNGAQQKKTAQQSATCRRYWTLVQTFEQDNKLVIGC